MSTDKADVYIDEKAVAAVDAKIRESQALTSGLMSSWAKPLEGITEGPHGKVTQPKPQEKLLREMPATVSAVDGKKLIKIPTQAIKCFKRILELCDGLEVRLTSAQSQMLLESVQAMPTPKRMMDAKAIFELIEALEK